MKKTLFLTLSFIILIFSWVFSLTANAIQIENIFSDIDANYEYYTELQAFYERWMISPDSEWKFNPYSLLERDEFVWISMEVACERCIQPHTEYKFIEKYWWKDIYFDVKPENNHFYCIAEADDKGFVKWYDAGFTCENGVSRSWERPFCPQNTITLEESVAVLLRNSGVFTIEDNQAVMQDILAGRITENISDDVSPTNSDGTPYTFYGYLRKALEFELIEFDTDGNERVYKMLEVIDGKIRPKKWITKQEFLLLSYIAFKSNSCGDITSNTIALDMSILPGSCTSSSDCSPSDLSWPANIYDFDSDVRWFCEEWIDDPDGYIWRFHNRDTGTRFFKYGPYIDNVDFTPEWNWDAYLRVVDACGNTWEVRSSFVSSDDDGTGLDTRIETDTTWDETEFIWVATWWTWPYIYEWDFWDGSTWTWEVLTHIYTNPGTYEVDLVVTDSTWNISVSRVIVTVADDWTITAREDTGNLTVDIEVDTLIWFEDLLVWVQWIVTGWVWPYVYEWDFWDGGTDAWVNLEHIYDTPWVYEVVLIVTDAEGNIWESTVLIQVLVWDSCDKDSDWDGIPDCEDKCPSVSGTSDNLWCPILDNWDSDPIDISVGIQESCVYDSSSAKIIWNAVCNSCPCGNFVDFLADIRECDIIFPAITSPDASTIYSKWKSLQIR